MRWNRQGLLWSTGSSLENRESTPEHRGHSSPLLGTRDIEQDPLCGQAVQPAETNPGPVLSVLDTSLPEHTNNPFVQDTNKGRFLAEHKEWIQRRDQLSCAHDMACLPPAPAAPGPHWPPLQHRACPTCVFLKRKPPVFLQEGRGRLSGRWTRGQIHQRWLHGSCASTSQHILTQLVASPAPCSGHQPPASGTVLGHVVCFCGHPQHRECRALGRGMGHPTSSAAAAHSPLLLCRGQGSGSFPW